MFKLYESYEEAIDLTNWRRHQTKQYEMQENEMSDKEVCRDLGALRPAGKFNNIRLEAKHNKSIYDWQKRIQHLKDHWNDGRQTEQMQNENIKYLGHN